ncbi:transposase [Nostoc sp.]|uniref:transposase n=1 Tax=Nostoc sp. TaxID=1180 RepID=UPI003FA54018
MSCAINWPENIISLAQPPHSPELNPIERLWQFLKKFLNNDFLLCKIYALAYNNCSSN